CAEARVTPSRAVAAEAGSTPATRAAVSAASTLAAWCSPSRSGRTGKPPGPTGAPARVVRPSGTSSVKLTRAWSSSASSAPRTSPVVKPQVTTGAAERSAIAATSRSSAFSTARPSGASASTSSPLAVAIASTPPNSPRWAEPTLSTRETSGRAIAVSWAMWPIPRAPISSTRKRVPAVTRSTVSGRPSSLVRLPAGATVGPAAARSAPSRSLLPAWPASPGDRGRLGDVADPARAHLEHEETGPGGHAQHGQRQAELVVEAPGGGHGGTGGREDRAQQILGAGLAGAAGDGEDHQLGVLLP